MEAVEAVVVAAMGGDVIKASAALLEVLRSILSYYLCLEVSWCIVIHRSGMSGA